MQDTFEALRSDLPCEATFAELESLATRLGRAAKDLASQARKLAAAAESGNIKALRKSLQSLELGISESIAIGKAIKSADIDKLARDLGGPSFLSEVAEAASNIGLTGVRISRNAVLSYPYRVEFDSSTSYRLGRRIITSMRPSAIARRFHEERAKTAAISPTHIDVLLTAYQVLSKGQFGIAVPLADIYDLLTILPASKKDYTESDFIRDVGILDERGPHIAKNGARVSFPASTSARMNRGYAVVNSKGDEVPYASIRFDHAKGSP